MPAQARCEIIDPSKVGVYHCWNRIVQRRCLFGKDHVTGKDFSYRKDWIRNRLRHLAGSMAIDVLDYALLDNHLHVVLRNRPDIVAALSDEQVARRWLYVCPKRRRKDGSIAEPKPHEIRAALLKADEYRERLPCISWFMRLASQTISRRANAEDGQSGRFFAERFRGEPLESVADVLNCSLYVDLNWIRAGMAETPEESVYTSAFDRIQARWQQMHREWTADAEGAQPELADNWLAPIFIDERSDAYVPPFVETSSALADASSTAALSEEEAALEQLSAAPEAAGEVNQGETTAVATGEINDATEEVPTTPAAASTDDVSSAEVALEDEVSAEDADAVSDDGASLAADGDANAPTISASPGAAAAAKPRFCNPIGSPRISEKGFLPITADQYLTLLDTVGRVVRAGKRGAIPADLPPILERLGLEAQRWFELFLDRVGIPVAPPPEPAAAPS